MSFIDNLKSKIMGTEDSVDEQRAVNGFDTVDQPIGEKQIREFNQILNKYREGKANLDKRIVDNEDWYKGYHWQMFDKEGKKVEKEVKPVSRYLFNAIANKHADGMDNFPQPNILPREEADVQEAKLLSSIIPVILDQCGFEETYSRCLDYKLKNGTCVYGIYWDASANNGLGEICIKKEDLLNLFWESGITNIQDSKYVFNTRLIDNELLLQQYPQLSERGLAKHPVDNIKYRYDDTVDTSDKSVVIDVYYKRKQTIQKEVPIQVPATNPDGTPVIDEMGQPIMANTTQIVEEERMVLHYCKYCNDTVLYATENDPEAKDKGLYDHAKYPFVFDTLYPVEGTPTGFGYIDIGKNTQEYIDRLNSAIIENALWTCKPRYFVSDAGNVNDTEFADLKNNLIKVSGAIVNDSIQPIQIQGLSSIYPNVLADKIEELKEVTGNRDVTAGGTTGGVTSASGIASMQEASSKQSRDNNKSSYRAFRGLIEIMIELIRQFYDVPRYFRIAGEKVATEYTFTRYTNANIQPQLVGSPEEFGIENGYRIPMFDVEVTVQKKNSYSTLAQNELALQFYNLGFFNPTMAEQSVACLEMMDFDRKDAIIQKIQDNSAMYQAFMQMAAMLGAYPNGEEGSPLPSEPSGDTRPDKMAQNSNLLGGDNISGGNSIATKAKERVAAQTSPQ